MEQLLQQFPYLDPIELEKGTDILTLLKPEDVPVYIEISKSQIIAGIKLAEEQESAQSLVSFLTKAQELYLQDNGRYFGASDIDMVVKTKDLRGLVISIDEAKVGDAVGYQIVFHYTHADTGFQFIKRIAIGSGFESNDWEELVEDNI